VWFVVPVRNFGVAGAQAYRTASSSNSEMSTALGGTTLPTPCLPAPFDPPRESS
jgi:hypothetical protein